MLFAEIGKMELPLGRVGTPEDIAGVGDLTGNHAPFFLKLKKEIVL